MSEREYHEQCVRIPGGVVTMSPRTLTIGDGERPAFAFEMHSYCGPMRCSLKTGDPIQAPFPKEFWPLFDRWTGNVDANGRCELRNYSELRP